MSKSYPQKALTIKEAEHLFNVFQRRIMKIEDEVEAMKRKLFKEVDEREVERLRKEMKK